MCGEQHSGDETGRSQGWATLNYKTSFRPAQVIQKDSIKKISKKSKLVTVFKKKKTLIYPYLSCDLKDILILVKFLFPLSLL